MDPGFFLADLTSRDETYQGQVAVHRVLPAREPAYGTLAHPLPPELTAALARAGIERFYVHQARAIERLRARRHTIVATGTASGKTLAYHVPVLERLAAGDTALYLSPTKALAQDQLRQVRRLDAPWVRADTYDGDTPTSVRADIRRNANLILTNPDMLHIGVLPNHELWKGFLRRLAFVVVDEAHTLRGIFGSHVALVLRRLRRLAGRYGASPTFALASATIGNPAEHASALTGVGVDVVDDDGAPAGQRHVVFWNPPFLDPDEQGKRKSSNGEAAELLAELVSHGAQTLAFSKSRVSAELVARYARGRLEPGDQAAVVAYRAGYLAAERRTIEQGLQDGTLRGVSATNALELGIDIGELDAVVVNGFPGTVASARQQMGRAGRTGQASLAVLVPQDEPLDQYYTGHPNSFFAKPHEAALVNPSNPHILAPHLGCAAYEIPLGESDQEIFGSATRELARELEASGVLRERRGRLYWSRRRPPADDVGIRSAGGSPFRIVEDSTGRLIGTVDEARAYQSVHPGAIYLHQGETFRVRDLVLDDRVALVSGHREPEYTQAKTASDLVVLKEERAGRLPGAALSYGLVEVTEQVMAYQRKRLPDGEVIDTVDLDLPPQTLVTRAVWYTLPEDRLLARLDHLDGTEFEVVLGGLHAAEHAGIGILPVFAMCDRWDIGGLSTNLHPDTGEPTIFIYDGHPMGAGITEHAFEVAADHLRETADHVEGCPCRDGCPSCVQSPKCGNWNEPLHKRGAVEVLRLILGDR